MIVVTDAAKERLAALKHTMSPAGVGMELVRLVKTPDGIELSIDLPREDDIIIYDGVTPVACISKGLDDELDGMTIDYDQATNDWTLRPTPQSRAA
jgi:hypothetical protein